MSSHPDWLRDWIRVARAAGWTVEYTGRRHLRWNPPGGTVIFSAGTPGKNNRSNLNLRSQLRRAGLKIP